MKVSLSSTSPMGRRFLHSRSRRSKIANYLAQLYPQTAPGVGPAGYAFDFSDLTAEKLAWRRNQALNSDLLPFGTPYVTTVADAPPPAGYAAAMKISATATLGVPIITMVAKASSVTFTVLTKKGNFAVRNFLIRNSTTATNLGQVGINFDTAPGSLSPEWSDAGGGWFKMVLTQSTGIRPGDTIAFYCGSTGGDPEGVNWYLAGVQVENGAVSTPYQKITDAYTEFLAAYPYHSLFKENTFVTPVMAAEDLIGGALDLRFGGARGTDLAVNGSFDVDASWTKGTGWTISGGRASRSNVANGSVLGQNYALVPGRLYELTIDYFDLTPGGAYAIGFRGGTYVSAGGAKLGLGGTGTVKVMLAAVAGNTSFELTFSSGTGYTGSFDNFTIREVYGNHAIQATTGDRPVASSRVNRLIATDALTNTALWVHDSITVTGGQLAPDGTNTATLLVPTIASAPDHRIRQDPAIVGVSRTHRGSIKASGNTWVKIRHGSAYLNVNLVTGALGSSVGVEGVPAVTPAGNGFWEVVFTIDGTLAGGNFYYYPSDQDTASLDNTAFAGDGVKGITVWRPSLVPGKVAVPYQRVSSATDYDTVGFPMGARFNGINTWMQIPSLDLSTSDKALFFSSTRKESDTATAVIFEHGIGGTNPLSFSVTAPRSAGPYYGVQMRDGTNEAYISPGGYTAPHTAVISTGMDYAGATAQANLTPRINGVGQVASGVKVTSVAFGNYPGYIGRKGGTILPFTGLMHRLGVRGGVLALSDQLLSERWVNERTQVAMA